MSDQRSAGSKLGGLAGAIIIIAFFLPWIRACGTEATGYDLATNNASPIIVEDAWVYWLTLMAGVVCILLFLFVPTVSRSNCVSTAAIRLAVGAVGFLPLLNIWHNVQQRGDAIEILYGGWLVVAAYLGVFFSAGLDFVSEKPPNEESSEW